MKCICTKRCQFRGIVPKGTVLDLTELELAIPHVKASFKPLEESAGAKRPEAKGGQRPADPPLTGADGAPLPTNAQMSTEALRQRLEAAGVRVPEGANRQQLFSLLQETLAPSTGKGA